MLRAGCARTVAIGLAMVVDQGVVALPGILGAGRVAAVAPVAVAVAAAACLLVSGGEGRGYRMGPDQDTEVVVVVDIRHEEGYAEGGGNAREPVVSALVLSTTMDSFRSAGKARLGSVY